MGTPVTIQNRIYLLREEVQQLQDRLKAMYAGDLSPESRLNGYKVIANKQKERISQLQADLDRMGKEIECLNRENDQLVETCLAAGFIGKGTTIIGDKRYEELVEAEIKNKQLNKIIDSCRIYFTAAMRAQSLGLCKKAIQWCLWQSRKNKNGRT